MINKNNNFCVGDVVKLFIFIILTNTINHWFKSICNRHISIINIRLRIIAVIIL